MAIQSGTVNVLMAMASEPHLVEQIRHVSPRVNLTHLAFPALAQDMAVMLPYLKETEVLLTFRADFELEDAPRLKWIQYTGAGVDYLRNLPVMRSDVIITNAHLFATAIAEYVMLSILSFRHRFPQILNKYYEDREWPQDPWATHRSEELGGTTIGIIGYGDIGHAVAQSAKGLEMRVLATRARASEPYEQDGVLIFPAHFLTDVLADSDQVVLCLPLTAETEQLIGEQELRAMKRNAYLVNVGRGKVIDDDALLRALKEGWIAGAGLDVHSTRPLRKNSPFFDLPNVMLTPHISGTSFGYEQRLVNLFCDNLERYLGGEPLLNVVDKKRGY